MNRGLRYGDGFFETIRIKDRQIPLLDFHLTRARLSAKAMEMEWPNHWDATFLEDQILENNRSSDVIARVDFWRAGQGTYSPEMNNIEFDVSYRAYQPVHSVFTLNGAHWHNEVSALEPVQTVLYEIDRKPIWEWSFIKSTSAAFYVKAGIWLRKQEDANDLILLNTQGNICEGLTSNIILKIGNRFVSPSPDQGAVEGVYQSYLSSIIPLEYVPISVQMLRGADEIWLTNAVHGIRRAQLAR